MSKRKATEVDDKPSEIERILNHRLNETNEKLEILVKHKEPTTTKDRWQTTEDMDETTRKCLLDYYKDLKSKRETEKNEQEDKGFSKLEWIFTEDQKEGSQPNYQVTKQSRGLNTSEYPIEEGISEKKEVKSMTESIQKSVESPIEEYSFGRKVDEAIEKLKFSKDDHGRIIAKRIDHFKVSKDSNPITRREMLIALNESITPIAVTNYRNILEKIEDNINNTLDDATTNRDYLAMTIKVFALALIFEASDILQTEKTDELFNILNALQKFTDSGKSKHLQETSTKMAVWKHENREKRVSIESIQYVLERILGTVSIDD